MAWNITLSGLKDAILLLHLVLTVHATFKKLGSIDIHSGLKRTTVPFSSLGPLLIVRPAVFVPHLPLAGVPGPVSRLWPLLGQIRGIHSGSVSFGFRSGPKKFLGQKQIILTYNTALSDVLGESTLGPGVTIPSRTIRRDAIIEQLKNSPADVLCLQEVWYGPDLNAIIDALRPKFPYSFSSIHDPSGALITNGLDSQPACPSVVFIPFLNCLIAANCVGDATSEEVLTCIMASCSAEFSALPQDCWICIVTIGPDLNEIGQRCTDTIVPGPYRKMNEGGLLMLSRREMRNQAYVDFHLGTREIVTRGFIEAEVKGMGQVVCAHTTTHSQDTYREFELQAVVGFTSYTEQGTFELNTLVERFSGLKKLLLAGDFNTGPGFPPNVIADSPAQFAILAKAFNVSPIRQCSFCDFTENVYNGVREPNLKDHIFFKGYKALRRKRVFDDVTVDGFPLSDHFGVIQEFRCKRY